MVNESKFLSRKWGMGMLIIVIASVALFVGTMTASVWAAVVGSVFAGYGIMNVSQKAVTDESK